MSEPYAVIVTWMDGQQEIYRAHTHRVANGELVLYDEPEVGGPQIDAWHLPQASIRVWKPDYTGDAGPFAVRLEQAEARWLSVVAANALRRDAEDMADVPHHRRAWDKLQPACQWTHDAAH